MKSRKNHKQFPDFDSGIFFDNDDHNRQMPQSCNPDLQMPSRMASDQMINIYFQEWSPLFPVLHRPTTLKQYAEFVVKPDEMEDQDTIVQLYLIFGIASLSAEVGILPFLLG